MGFVQELVQLLSRLSFYEKINEYESGVWFRNGRVIERRVRLSRQEKQAARFAEWDLVRAKGGLEAFLTSEQELPEGWRAGRFTGFPRHPDRYRKSKNLSPGIYLFWPVYDSIHTTRIQEKMLNLQTITALTTEEQSKSILISANLRYRVKDFYRAYTVVDDYEQSLKDYALSMLAKKSRGKTFDEWKKPKVVEKLEEDVLGEMRHRTLEWGLEVMDLYVTDCVPCKMYKLVPEGQAAVKAPTSQLPTDTAA